MNLLLGSVITLRCMTLFCLCHLANALKGCHRISFVRGSGNVEFITNVYFSGLQPDFTFIGSLGERHIGPLGNYHSKIVLGAFLADLTAKETAALFCDKAYRELGYYDEFEVSKAKLLEVDANNTIRFAEEFFPSHLCSERC